MMRRDKMKIRKTIYWIVGIIVLLGWTDLVWGKTPSSTKTVINQTAGDTLEIEVKGLVCSFCAHGLNKGIGKMDYTDKNNVFVDINNQIVKIVFNKKYKAIPSSIINQTIKVIENSGYEVQKITYQNKVIVGKEK
jgi:ribosomal protein L24E